MKTLDQTHLDSIQKAPEIHYKRLREQWADLGSMVVPSHSELNLEAKK